MNNFQYLSNILDSVISHYEGEKVLKQIKNVLKLSQQSNIKKAYQKLSSFENKEIYAKAFSTYLNLANICEALHRKERIDYYHEHNIEQKYTLKESLALKENIKDLTIEFVFTAHPTEFKRKTLITNNQSIYKIMKGNKDKKQLFNILSRIWTIGDSNRMKPNPLEEAKRSYHYLETTLYKELPKKVLEIDNSGETNPFKFSSWVGGDRDGNPFVTAKVTEEIILHQKSVIQNLYKKDIEKLKQALAMKVDDESLPSVTYPYRYLLEKMNLDDIVACIDTLDLIIASLSNHNSEHLCDDLKNLKIRMKSFGKYMLPLDLRQDSSFHQEAITELLDIDYQAMSEKEKLKALKQNTKKNHEVLDTINLIKKYPDAFNVYIISMTKNLSDILELEWLMKQRTVDLPIVPLFETVEDLQNGPEIFRQWIKASKKKKYMLMLGYSDSMKTGGKFASVFNLYKAQETFLAVAREENVELVFFHGKGGSIARGGGPIVDGIKGQPPGSVGKHFRSTIQGEMIDSLFAFPEITSRSLDLYLYACISHKKQKKDEKFKTLYENIATNSKKSYNELLNHPDFISFYQEVTPVDEISLLKVGSRPSKRKNTTSINDLRAIPWVLSWTQNRSLLPAWYGVASAFKQEKKSILKQAYKESLFFKNFIELLVMVMAKSKPDIFNFYFDELSSKDLKQLILNEYKDLEDVLKHIRGQKELLLNNPKISESIKKRNPYVDPLNLLQVFALKNYRKYESYDNLLVTCFSGIANGLKNSG